jgi:hypothetical protein
MPDALKISTISVDTTGAADNLLNRQFAIGAALSVVCRVLRHRRADCRKKPTFPESPALIARAVRANALQRQHASLYRLRARFASSENFAGRVRLLHRQNPSRPGHNGQALVAIPSRRGCNQSHGTLL